MLTQRQGKQILGLCLGIVISTICIPTQAQPKPGSPPPKANTASKFQKAKEELNPSHYLVYRIVDRIARANQLDDRPWRIVVENAYEINADQSEINRIRIFSGLLDQVSGDASALACVVGHELAHSTERHAAKIAAVSQSLQEKYQKQFEKDLRPGVGRIIGNIFLGGTIKPKDPEQVKAKNEAELTEAVSEARRQQELEADQVGFKFIVVAGFEPEGCSRMLSILSRLPAADIDGESHPALPRRIDKMKELMAAGVSPELITAGQNRVNASNPLTYEPSADGVSLRINSTRGGSTVTDLERVLGE